MKGLFCVFISLIFWNSLFSNVTIDYLNQLESNLIEIKALNLEKSDFGEIISKAVQVSSFGIKRNSSQLENLKSTYKNVAEIETSMGYKILAFLQAEISQLKTESDSLIYEIISIGNLAVENNCLSKNELINFRNRLNKIQSLRKAIND